MNTTPGQPETLIGHLLELRSRLMKAVLGVLLIFAILVPFANDLYAWLASPLLAKLPEGAQLIATDVTSPFFAPFKLALFAALMLGMPIVLYQAWAFVAPGLYQHEKRLARPLLVAATLLFYAGCAFAYWVLLPLMFGFLTSTVPEGVAMMTDINSYLSFVIVMFLAAGISFEMPVAVLIAVAMGVVTPDKLSEWRGYVVVGIFILAAIITPPDGISQVLLAIPMCLLYEAGILVARVMIRRRATQAPA